MQPSPPRFAAALSSGIAMLLAIGLPTIAGRADVGLLASAGALSALYLGSRSRHERARRLPIVQLALLAAAAVGAVSAAQPVLAAAAVALVAVVAAALVLGLRLGPPGALFAVLIAGIAQRLAAPGSQGGLGLSVGGLLAGVALGEVVAYLVVVAPVVVASVRRRDAARPIVAAGFRLGRPDRMLLTRVAIGVTLATAVGAALGLHRSYWVVVATLAVLQATIGRRRTALRGVHRLLGTIGGTAIFAGLAVLHPQGLLPLVISLLQFLVELVVVRHYGVALLLITPLALTIAEAGAGGDVGPTVRDRVVDTVAGVLIAGVVLVVEFGAERLRRARRAASRDASKDAQRATTTGATRTTPDSPRNR